MPWHAKTAGGYTRTSQEALENAQSMYGVWHARGWTVNSVAAVLGNVEVESGYNPWRWQSDDIGLSTGSPWTNKGYGFFQFTPGGKYINATVAQAISGYGPNFSDKQGSISDGYAQCVYIDGYADYYSTTDYPLSFAEFKASTESPAYLARAWLYNYERPEAPGATVNIRSTAAEYWYQILSGEEPPPDPGPGPGPSTVKKLPIWMMCRRWI